MAKSKVETCMFCEAVPCQCNARKPKAKSRPARNAARDKRAPTPASATPPEPVLASSADVSTPIPTPAITPRERATDLLVEQAALQALASIMTYDSRTEHKVVLTSTMSAEEEVRVWRAQHS